MQIDKCLALALALALAPDRQPQGVRGWRVLAAPTVIQTMKLLLSVRSPRISNACASGV